jgi:hypothetical protein
VQRLPAAGSGGDELAGAVEVEGAGQAEADEDLIADLEAAVAVFLGLELAPQRLAGGVVTGQQQAARPPAGSEPGVGAAVEEEQLSGARAAGAAAAVLAAAAWRPAVALGSQPAAERFIGEEDVVLLGEDVGEEAEVEVGVGGGGQVEDLLLQLGGVRLAGGRAVLRWMRPWGPSARRRCLRRRTCRGDRRKAEAASWRDKRPSRRTLQVS